MLVRFAELLATTAPTITRIRSVPTITTLLKDPPPELDWPSGEVARPAEQFPTLFARTEWSDEVEAEFVDPAGEFGFNPYVHRYTPPESS
ncbi:hypothetical protein D5S18_18775 [Nocardia panacis]|uniref:Uncharacterized protein n=1 Tax=Nocardia panacis TaxID=2340916 RepID=A0A3A4K5T1_9NOCA|nr:hypothetical protein [Nocardia panacis]RJO74006.1 hypothetical protein D5S18_18775 [Nocardia panacis]